MPLPTDLILFRTTPPVVLPTAPLRITVPEAWRADVFRPELEHARLTFDAYAARHAKVATALADKALIERLAITLDDYLGPCIVADVNGFARTRFQGQNITEAMYLQYIAACLQGGADPYRPSAITMPTPTAQGVWTGIEPLFERYPLMRYMLTTMTEQYINAVLRCCDRLLEDWADIGTFFFNTALATLTEIKGTGSDFHKGGQQVFLLTLLDTANAPQRLVYKPSDVERDFRVVGDTQALRGVLNHLHAVAAKGVTLGNLLNNPGGSLVEMVEAFAAQDQVSIPVTKYKILPVHPGTSLQARPSGGYDIRQSYGWIEFLSSTLQDKDCPNTVALADYYQTYGAMLALAYVFQITDLHQENVIVHSRRPYLVDLEMAYPGFIELPTGTGLGDAYKRFGVTVLRRSVDGWNSHRLSYERPGVEEPAQNQPYLSGVAHVPGPKDAGTVLGVFNRTVGLIVNHPNDFDAWLANASGVIARVAPFGTDDLLLCLRTLNNPSNQSAASRPDEVRLRTQEWARDSPIGGGLKGWGDQFVAGTANMATPFELYLQFYGLQPLFAFWLHGQTAEDFLHGDVPAFYQRVGQAQALDSCGEPIAVDFGRAVLATASADQATLTNRLIQLWPSVPPLPPLVYFPGGSATAMNRAYLNRLATDAVFQRARMSAAQQDISRW